MHYFSINIADLNSYKTSLYSCRASPCSCKRSL